MTPSIAFVGAGPTTIYTLAALLDVGPHDVSITIFEQQPVAGFGTPYRPGWNDPAMLANIASVEIPRIRETLVEWLKRKSCSELASLGVAPAEIDERAFLPRVVLGRYFADQFDGLVGRAKALGVEIEVRTASRVIDALSLDDGVRLTIAPHLGFVTDETFDYVVLATGHQWPLEAEFRPGYFLTPWPASNLSALPASRVGIRGTSLTAIDTAIALAVRHGKFLETRSGEIIYAPHDDALDFGLTLMSRKGILPEADFYFPLPHPPLSICTPEAIEALLATGGCDLLDAAFDLFRKELIQVDPDYARAIDLPAATLESFSEAYFASRAASDPFEWARCNLEEAERNHRAEITVAWRDAILRMHEVVGMIVPCLNHHQFERFERSLKAVFVDNYGALPHRSVSRLLALHRAGRLEIIALGENYRLDSQPAEGCGAAVQAHDWRRHFPIFIDATGQRPLPAKRFPFPSLLAQGVISDAVPLVSSDTVRGVALDDAFHPLDGGVPADRLFCLSLPFLMGRHPFVQGVTSSHDLGKTVAAALSLALGEAGRGPAALPTTKAA